MSLYSIFPDLANSITTAIGANPITSEDAASFWSGIGNIAKTISEFMTVENINGIIGDFKEFLEIFIQSIN